MGVLLMRHAPVVHAPRRLVAALVGGTLTVAAGAAHAGDFFQDGTFHFAPNALAAFDFADGAPPLIDPESDDEPALAMPSESALSGPNVIVLGQYQSVDVQVPLPEGPRTLRASVWVRHGEGVGYLVVTQDDEGHNGGEINTLYPTGRVTSDGWYELANSGLRADGRYSEAVLGVFSPTGAEVDAAEVILEGAAAPVTASCEGAADGASCGEGQVCYWSKCRNLNGWVPPIPDDRDDVAFYLENRLRFFFGPYLNRQLDLPAALGAIDRMKTATDPWSYWNGFMLGVRRLHDGHTTTSSLADFSIQNPKPLNVCFVEGDADLSHQTAPSDGVHLDVLVSHTGDDQNLGLKRGDRLVRIDGTHPIAWARSLEENAWSHAAVSNHRTHAEHASGLRRFISRFAHELEVIRCDEQTATCGELEVISLADVPVLGPDETAGYVACDNRPLRHVPDAPADHGGPGSGVFFGVLDESDDVENIYGVEWQSLYTTDGNDGVGQNLRSAISAIEDDAASGVILDHRTGNGGTFGGPAIIWEWAVARKPLTFFQDRQLANAEQPSLAVGAELFQAAIADDDVIYAGGTSPTTIPIALLITEDVSASDWLPLGLKGAPNVRIFGPYETNGGFSTRFQLSYHLGLSVVLASGDSFIASGFTHNGTGVSPDVVVLPKQSDLLAGVDTVHAAALEWIREELQ